MTGRSSAVLAGLCFAGTILVPPPAAAGLADPAARKLVNKCTKAILQGGAKFSTVELKALDACFGGVLTCMHTKPSDTGCIAKAEERCATLTATLNAAEAKLSETFTKACGGLPSEDLLAADGLGLASLAGTCSSEFLIEVCGDVTNSNLIDCLVKTHARRTRELFPLQQPRAGELLQSVLASSVQIDELIDYGCDDCSQPPSGSGKAIAACGATITKSARTFVGAVRKGLGECVGKISACMQSKTPDPDPKCLVKAKAKCSATAAKLDVARGKLRAALEKKCGAVPFDTLASGSALNLAALAEQCADGGNGFTGIGDYVACLQRGHQCDSAALLRQALPISGLFATTDLSGNAAAVLAGNGCPAPAPADPALTAAPNARLVSHPISRFFNLRRLFSNGSGVPAAKKGFAAPGRTGNAPRRISFKSAPPRFQFGALQKISITYSGTNGRGGAAGPPTLIATARRDDLVVTEHFELPLDALAPDGLADVDLEFEYAQDVPFCAFDIALAIQDGDGEEADVSDYSTLPRALDESTPVPTATLVPTATRTPTPDRTGTPTKTRTPTPSRTPTPTPSATPVCLSSQPLACGESLTSTIVSNGDTRCFTFDAEAGDAFVIHTLETSSNLNACWQAFTAAGPTSVTCGQGKVQLTASGPVTIRVAGSSATQTGEFTLTMDAVSATFGGGSNGGDDPVCKLAADGTQALHCGETKGGSFDFIGEGDAYTFTAAAGDDVIATIVHTTGGTGCVELYGPTGAFIDNGCPSVRANLTAAGVHTIRAIDSFNDQLVSYNVTLEVVSQNLNGVSTAACITGGDGVQAIACGETKPGVINTRSDTDTFTFLAAGGETVGIATGTADPNISPCWTLFAPNGDAVETPNRFCGTTTRKLPPLPQAGTFTIFVQPNSASATGSYNVNLEAVSATFNGGSNAGAMPACGIAGEGVQTIGCGQTVSGAIDDPADQDTWTFQAKAEEGVSITVAPTTLGLDTCWYLFAPNGDAAGSSCGSKGVKLPNQGGTYTINVLDTGDDEEGTYNLTLESTSALFNGQSSATCIDAATITCGQTPGGSLADPGDTDSFHFEADASEAMVIGIADTSPTFRPCWSLYDPTGAQVGSTTCDNTVPVKLQQQTGIYTVVVAATNNSTGQYRLSVEGISSTFNGQTNGGETPICNQGTDGTQPLLCGDTKSGTFEISDDTDTYTFSASGNDAVSITAVQDGSSAQPCWVIYKSDGNPLTNNICADGTTVLQPPAGVYTIFVFNNGGQAGNYNITLETVSASFGLPTGPSSATCIAGGDGTTVLGCGETKGGTINKRGDVDTYTFTGTAGANVTITAVNAGVDACWRLYGPTGAPVGNANCDQTPGLRTPTLSGTHTIRVYEDGHNNTGDYTIAVSGTCS